MQLGLQRGCPNIGHRHSGTSHTQPRNRSVPETLTWHSQNQSRPGTPRKPDTYAAGFFRAFREGIPRFRNCTHFGFNFARTKRRQASRSRGRQEQVMGASHCPQGSCEPRHGLTKRIEPEKTEVTERIARYASAGGRAVQCSSCPLNSPSVASVGAGELIVRFWIGSGLHSFMCSGMVATA